MIDAPDLTIREARPRARETKLVADISLFPHIVAWARARFEPDGHGRGPCGDEYATSTLYFETQAFDVYRRVGSYGRAKYRIRRYNDGDAVFLERKFRTEQLLAKRRTLVELDAIGRLSLDRADPAWGGFWFHRRLLARKLRPLVQLSYDRVARVGRTPHGQVRMTIDRNMRALPLPDYAFLPSVGQPYLEGTCIVEVKYQMAMPTFVRELAGTFRLDVAKMSKFRSALRALDYPLERDPGEDVPQPLRAANADPAGTYAD